MRQEWKWKNKNMYYWARSTLTGYRMLAQMLSHCLSSTENKMKWRSFPCYHQQAKHDLGKF